ncbi:ABC transporter permease [Gordonia sp. ABSL49_1]|uniref:ABC transporter permease n=1 Tax=unclassified Gordonia (in: high G+C Gram-positive bacteria) TaxID=2657482 RepID=UPI001F0FCB51|nr:ABC transporter permease [Gordonia sp. ABSL49_1]MCH5644840.1 ABC transporter permease [Gordonia sp. ABSL49_1]
MTGLDLYLNAHPRARRLADAASLPGRLLAMLGHQLRFAAQVIGAVPHTLRHYRNQTLAVLGDMMWGSGTVIVGGGTVAVLVVLGASVGGSIGVEAFGSLDMFGMGPLTGFLSAYATTREIAPIVAAIGFAAQAGCRMTAEIGAMRISEEIDALEAQAVTPIPFVVTTRAIAGVVTIIPLFLITLVLAYLTSAWVVTGFHGQSSGTYEHYFNAFLRPIDVFYAVIKVVVFIVAVVLVHGYQGFYARGGPEGVGAATGRAIKFSFILIVVLDMLLTLVFWGTDVGFRFSG